MKITKELYNKIVMDYKNGATYNNIKFKYGYNKQWCLKYLANIYREKKLLNDELNKYRRNYYLKKKVQISKKRKEKTQISLIRGNILKKMPVNELIALVEFADKKL